MFDLSFENLVFTKDCENGRTSIITAREVEIIALLLVGNSYAEISEKLFIAHSTVKTHVQRIYRKTNVSNKIQLMNVIKA